VIATAVFLLSAHLASGTLIVTSLLLLRNRLPHAFLRFCVASSAVFAAIAWKLGHGLPSLVYGLLAAAAALVYWWLRRKESEPALPLTLTGVLALAALGFECGGSESVGWLLCSFGAAGSSLLLGSVVVSMVLGHWYLVDTTLSIAPLKDGALLFGVAVLWRWLNVLVVLAREGWDVVRVTNPADVFYSTLGLFFLFRAITGLIAPLLLAGPILQTVRMRSTQSATGLLYVAMVVVLFGELIAQFLTSATGFPL
jgi:hypothetical protein